MIVGVQDIHYHVTDMRRAVAFYRDVLGMQVLDSNEWWTSLECFGARVGLHGTGGEPADGPAPRPQTAIQKPLGGATLTLRSTDLGADLAYLARCGVPVLDRSDNDWGKVAVFADSEGNLLKLMQPPSRT